MFAGENLETIEKYKEEYLKRPVNTSTTYLLSAFLICIPLLSHTTSTPNQDHIIMYRLFLKNAIFNVHIEGPLTNGLYFFKSMIGCVTFIVANFLLLKLILVTLYLNLCV